jgi:hypothetical protein
LESAPNGWGQHVHPTHGQSHNMLHYLKLKYGGETVRSVLDEHYESLKS